MSALQNLERRIRACRICRETPLRDPLPHEPRPVLQVSSAARLLIAGQAPGTRVHASGRPFTDPSGDRLRDWLGIDAATFYDARKVAIAPMGFCFPGQDARGADLPPRKECAPAWRGDVMEVLANVELVLAVGQYAQAWHLKGLAKRSLTETVANWREPFETLKPRVLPLPHPSWRNNAWLRNNPWFQRDVLPVLRREVARLVPQDAGERQRGLSTPSDAL